MGGGNSSQGMTEAHKAALARGRHETRVVRAYLDALEANDARPRRVPAVDVAAAEAAFIAIGADYASRKGLTYAAFRAVGVPASTLRAAGIPVRRKARVIRRR